MALPCSVNLIERYNNIEFQSESQSDGMSRASISYVSCIGNESIDIWNEQRLLRVPML